MRSIITLDSLLVILVVVVPVTVVKAEDGSLAIASFRALRQVAQPQNQFALDLYRLQQKNGNNFWCPYGVSTQLGMLLQGASGATELEIQKTLRMTVKAAELRQLVSHTSARRKFFFGVKAAANNGYGLRVEEVTEKSPAEECGLERGDLVLAIDGRPTRSEGDFAKAIDYSTGVIDLAIYDFTTGNVVQRRVRLKAIADNPNSEAPVFRSVTGLWSQKGVEFTPEFTRKTQDAFGTHFGTVDFTSTKNEAAKSINSWVAKETNNTISTIVSAEDLPRQTNAVLTNAVVFNGRWSQPFDKSKTSKHPFQLLSGKSMPVSMMWTQGSFNYAERKEYEAVELPYEGTPLSMMVFLPEKSVGILALEKHLTAKEICDALGNMQSTTLKIGRTCLPSRRLTLQCPLDLKRRMAVHLDKSPGY